MNVPTIKSLAYLSSFACMSAMAYSGYDYYENDREVTYFDGDHAYDVLNGVKAPKAPVPVALDFARDINPAVVEFDWTGKQPPPPEVVQAAESVDTPDPVIPVEDILEVIMVLSDPRDPGDSFCSLRFSDSNISPREQLFSVGASLPAPNEQVSVLNILADGVEFSFADAARPSEVVSLSLRSEGGDLIRTLGPGDRIVSRTLVGSGSGRANESDALQTERRNGQFYIGSDDAKQFAEGYQQILSQDVKTKTRYVDGKRSGVELTEVREGSIAARHGAQSGDVVISINGNPVNSQQEAIAFAKNNSERYSVWEVEVLRLGRIETVIYHSSND
ncbi:PDZ domain-containing protein [Planctomycetota bacterium]|nr:PDZ domain-containing protein [Planctomycetota bacterium]MDB4736459.1 PDZ domain-containing protein [Planctomycetota bacterium]